MPSSFSPSTHHKPFFSNSSPSPTSVSSTVKQDKADDVNSPRRLTRQRKLRHLSQQDLGFYVLPEKSRSSPSSPEYSSRKSCSPVGDSSRRKSCNSLVGPQGQVPQPLPLPDSSMMNRRPDSTVKDVYFFGPACCRKSIDQVLTTSASSSPLTTSASSSPSVKSSSNCNGNNWGCNNKLGLNVKSRKGSAPVTTISNSNHPIISPRRSNTVGIFPSHSSRVATNGSSNHFHWEMGMGMSQDVNFEQAGCNLSRSAPTSVFSSPAVSPRRANKGDPFPCLVDHQYYHQDAAAAFPSFLSPKTPSLSPNHSPLHSPTPRSPRFNHIASNGIAFDSNSLPTAHPLPLPPGVVAPVQPPPMTMHQNVVPPPPSMTMHQTVAPILYASSMKGQWQKGKLIGRGTFGSVYIATNRETGALCAMKEVDVIPDDPKSAESIKQLEQEIKVLRTLKHPNIVQYLGSEMIDDHFYIYLEYVHPGSINKYVRDHIGAMTESVVRNFTRHILSGLAFLHDKKTIHRDIKGANLLVDASGVVKLADFGMAKLLSAQSYDLSMKGSPYWMAPELIKAVIQNDADPNLALAVDIWSLGCTIIEMFNGKPPWSEFEGPQAMFKVLNRTPDIPENLSAEGKEFLSLCFRRNPAERPSAKKLLDHPFVRISNDKNVSSYAPAFSLVKLMDKLHSPKDHMKHNKVSRGG